MDIVTAINAVIRPHGIFVLWQPDRGPQVSSSVLLDRFELGERAMHSIQQENRSYGGKPNTYERESHVRYKALLTRPPGSWDDVA